jgi:hypothetical protein
MATRLISAKRALVQTTKAIKTFNRWRQRDIKANVRKYFVNEIEWINRMIQTRSRAGAYFVRYELPSSIGDMEVKETLTNALCFSLQRRGYTIDRNAKGFNILWTENDLSDSTRGAP